MSIALFLHIVFLLIWSAALMVFPHLLAEQLAEHDRADLHRATRMQHALYAYVMTPSALLAVVLGVWLIFERGFGGGWLQVKLALVLLMVFFHVYCGTLMGRHKEEGPPQGATGRRRLYRALPLLPALLITGVVSLVVAKPF